ncbi:MAG: HNH endonuclease [Malazfec virus 1]
MEEIWKDIEFTDTDGTHYDYTGIYQVSNMGRVRSLDRDIQKVRYGEEEIIRTKGRVMSAVYDNRGYLVVRLSKNGSSKMFKTHRLVAHMFVENPNPTKFTVVNHKDENTSNAVYTNLEWCDIAYNTTYGTSRERSGKSLAKTRQEKYWATKTCAVIGVNVSNGNVIEFESCKEAMQFLGLKSQSEITKRCKGKRKTCGGYTWSYKEEVV